MGKTRKRGSETSPHNWLDIVIERMDFEGAFRALEGYNHFHTCTLRGKLCMLMLRIEESWNHFEQAEEIYSKIKEPADRDQILYFYLLAYRFDNACYEEALDPTDEARRLTDQTIVELLEHDCPEAHVLDQIRLFSIANYQLMRGSYRSALTTFEDLIEESQDRLEDQRVGFFIGAAACAEELQMEKLAARHYENAALTVGLVEKNFKRALFYGKLYTLLLHWDREEEAKEWLLMLRRLECPESSQEYFVERAQYLNAATREHKLIFLG